MKKVYRIEWAGSGIVGTGHPTHSYENPNKEKVELRKKTLEENGYEVSDVMEIDR